LLANPALCSMLGYSESDLLAMSCSEFANPEDSEDDWALFQQLRAGVIDKYSLEKRYVRKDGTRFWGRLNVTLLTGSKEGSSPLVSAFVEDITERKRAEEDLRHSEEWFRLAAQAGKMYAYEWNPTSDLVTRSEEYANILGFIDAPEQLTRRQLAARVHPDDRARFISSVDQLTPENPTTQVSYRVLRPDRSVIWLEKSGRAFFDAQGRLLRMIGMVADITERKQAEERLREYEKAVEGSEEMIAVVDRQYRYLIANRKFLKLRNLTKEQVIGRLVPEVLNKGVFEEVVKDKLDQCFAGQVVKFEMQYAYPELGERDLLVSYFPIEGATGVDRAVCILQDITERKRAQEALKKSEEKF
jgi:PAS domain S-box-containing protein